MKKTAGLLLAAMLIVGAAPLHAQDAAAPIRRSPAPEESPTPTPPPVAAPTPARALPVETPAAPPAPTPTPPPEPPTPQIAPEDQPPREPDVHETPAAPPEQSPAPAEAARRRVIEHEAVRAAPTRPDWTPPPPQRRTTPAPAPAPGSGRRPTFDLGNVASGSPAAQVKALERRWQQALLDREIDVIRQLVAPDFVGTSTTGRTANKSTLLAEFRRDKNKYETATVRGMSVRSPSPEVAIVTGVATETGTTPDGKRFRSSRRFTDTWVNRNGRWQVVASHTTAL